LAALRPLQHLRRLRLCLVHEGALSGLLAWLPRLEHLDLRCSLDVDLEHVRLAVRAVPALRELDLSAAPAVPERLRKLWAGEERLPPLLPRSRRWCEADEWRGCGGGGSGGDSRACGRFAELLDLLESGGRDCGGGGGDGAR
jgi:hypothetical protein